MRALPQPVCIIRIISWRYPHYLLAMPQPVCIIRIISWRYPHYLLAMSADRLGQRPHRPKGDVLCRRHYSLFQH